MRRLFWILSVVIGSAALVSADTTGGIIGRTMDDSGAALPGVTIEIASSALQGHRTFTTDATGAFRFPLIPIGTYRVTAQLSGFQTVVKDAVVVLIGSQTAVEIKMAVAKVSESVTVHGDSVVIDPTRTGLTQTFTQEQLQFQSIGATGRDYLDVIQHTPGAVGAGNPNVFGANEGQNVFLVDGINTTDPVTHTFGANLGYELIQEVSVQTGGFNAEYGKAAGGVISVVTKSGGNQFAGSLDGRYQSNSMFTNGDHFNKDDQASKVYAPEASLGGPIMKDAVWFFLDAQRPVNEATPPNQFGFQPGTRDFKGWNLFAKVTATPSRDQLLTFRYTDDFADIPYGSDSSFVQPEADTLQSQRTFVYNLSDDVVLSPNWLVSVQAGVDNSYLGNGPITGDDQAIGMQDLLTGIDSVNSGNNQKSNRDRTQVLASTTYYFDAAGSHSVKLGTDLDWNKFTEVNNATGESIDQTLCSIGQPAGATCGAFIYTTGGSPYELTVSTILPTLTFKSRSYTGYLQDQWNPLANLTINYGVRWDQTNFQNENDAHIKTLTMFQPRVGVAWDILKDTSTVFHAHAGNFMDDNALTLASYLSTHGAVTDVYFNINNPYFGGTGCPSDGADAAGWAPCFAYGGPSGNRIQPGLKPTYSQELSAGITRKLSSNMSLDVSYIYRTSKHIIEDACVDGTCTTSGIYWLTNYPNGQDLLRSYYHGVTAELLTRVSDRFSLQAYATYSTSKGSVGYDQNAGSDFDSSPNLSVNRYGYLSDDARLRMRIDGFYQLPWGFTAGANWYWRTGTPYTVYLPNPNPPGYGNEYLESAGSRRLPHFHQLDMELRKNFPIGPVNAAVVASVYNVLDSETPLSRDGSVGTGGTVANPTNSDFNQDTSWQMPRSYEVGVHISF